MAVTGGFGDKKLNQSQVKDLKRNSNIVWMNDRWIYKEIQPYVHHKMQMQVGTFSGIIVSLVSLQNMKKVSFMIGIVIVGINPINEKEMIHLMVKLENYQ